jgi:hypothetical protein
MDRDNALMIIIKHLVDNANQPVTFEYLYNRISQTSIEIHKTQLFPLLWKMHNDNMITIRAGIIHSN